MMQTMVIIEGGKGVSLRNSCNCTIKDNKICDSERSGLSSYQSFNNLIENNDISKNGGDGIHMSKSSYNANNI